MFWRRRKALAAYNNRWQWQREFAPSITPATEILMEHLANHYLVIESSVSGTPTYIITE